MFRSKKRASLVGKVKELAEQIEALEARLSVVEGRSSMNAERVVRAHSSLQNLAEGYVPQPKQKKKSKSKPPQGADPVSADDATTTPVTAQGSPDGSKGE